MYPIYYWRRAEKQLRKNEKAEQKQKQRPVVDVCGGESKVRCCKEQYCTVTLNVRSMNQELEMVKQEMASVNIYIVRISELKCINGELNLDDHYIY